VRAATNPKSPNYAVERTRLRVTTHAPTTFAPAAHPHGPRRYGVSLTLWALGVIHAHSPMKTKCYALLACFLSITAFAKPPLGEFAAEMPGWKSLKNPSAEDQKTREMYLMTAQRIEITAGKLVLKTGNLTSETMTYTAQGEFLLGRSTRFGGDVFFTPFYVADKDTIFGNGFKFTRTK
jgi:hypothetical protein